MLSANSALAGSASLFDLGVLLSDPAVSQTLAGGDSIPEGARIIGTSPPPPVHDPQELPPAGGTLFPDPTGNVFELESLPGATKTIYLDFDGLLTQNTPWNTATLPNIVTLPYDFDEDFTTFSTAERNAIRGVWERVSEDFLPFEVNVTTKEPTNPTDALSNTGGSDETWGIRVAIGGSTFDWFTPVYGGAAGGVAFIGSFTDPIDNPAFVFGGDYQGAFRDLAEAVSHEVGHTLGLSHDGQTRYWLDTESGEFQTVHLEYYPGHPDPPGNDPTDWAPIMGVGYGKQITQWSKGEYLNSTNVEDDLLIITTQNGFDYREDDFGNTFAQAGELEFGSLTSGLDVSTFVGNGIVERNTDIDFFSFTVEGLGELVSFNIDPFYNGPNLDILATLYDTDGTTVLATSDSIDVLNAAISERGLVPGTYYLSIQGDDRPITYVDPTAHPGPIVDIEDGEIPPDLSDWGYSNYGSLGYYSIVGTRKRAIVGVDFDAAGGTTPTNWNLFSGGSSPAVLGDATVVANQLISEAGLKVPYTLTIGSSGPTINAVASTSPIPSADLPDHGVPLNELTGYLSTTTDTLTFEWSNLTPSTVYQVYVFGHASGSVKNHVTVVGGDWNGVQQVYDFTQDVSANGLEVNNNEPGNEELSSYSLLVISDASGRITIAVSGADGAPAGIAGLGISSTKVGSIEGQKWNDANGDSVHDAGEAGLEGWVIYLDLNNDGMLNSTANPNVTVQAPNVPQPLQDYATVKNELVFVTPGTVSDLNVTVDIMHTYDADLNVYLISPAGTRVKLFADIGGTGDNFHNTTLDDEATIAITSGAAPFTGTYRPQEPLSAFDGENAAGIWKLEIEDDATSDTGQLNGWSITIDLAGGYLEPFDITDADGNYMFADLPAGQYHVRENFSLEQTLAGWQQTLAPAPVTVRSGANVQDIDFGNWIAANQAVKPGSIQGVKFNDANGDGVRNPGEAGLEGWVVYVDANGNGIRDIASVPTTFTATGLPKAITDFNSVISPVNVSALGTVFSVQVTLDITHSFVGDLEAYLYSPSGTRVELFTQVGGQYNDFTNLTLDDSAARSIATLGIDDLPYTGTWGPEQPLNNFLGDDVFGTWILEIRDTAFADQGTLNSWSLKVTSGEVFRTTAADGNYLFADLPAGQYVIREENQAGWQQIAPAVTSIPAASPTAAATWTNSKWTVNVVAVDDPGDPAGADSHRNVKDVNFGNRAAVALPGDYTRSNVVDAGDYVLWRKLLGTTVANSFDGPDGNGNGQVDAGDHGVWRAHFGDTTTPPGSGSVALASVGFLDAAVSDGVKPSPDSNVVAESAVSAGQAVHWMYHRAADRPSGRRGYRPVVADNLGVDQALLAWVAESRAARDAGSTDNAISLTAGSEDADAVDSVFESLECGVLSGRGAV